MKLHPRVEILIMTTFIFVMILWGTFIIMNWHMLSFFIITAVITFITILYGTYTQKTSQPHCKHCGSVLRIKEMNLIGQDELVKRGRFVFYYKYEYKYQCPNCEVTTYTRTVKDKNHLPVKNVLSSNKSKF